MTRAPGAGDQLRLLVAEVPAGRSRVRGGRLDGHRGTHRRGILAGPRPRRRAAPGVRHAGRRRRRPQHRRAGRGGSSGGARRQHLLPAHRAGRRGDRPAARAVGVGPAAQSAGAPGNRSGPPAVARHRARGRLRHRVLPRPAARGGDLRHRPRIGRSLADPPVRVPRHLAPLRQRAGRGLPGSAAARPETDRAAPGQRLLGVGDRRHPAPRHLDGVDAAGGTGDGYPQR